VSAVRSSEYVLGVVQRIRVAIDRLKVDPRRPMSSQERIGWEACRRAALREVDRVKRDFRYEEPS